MKKLIKLIVFLAALQIHSREYHCDIPEKPFHNEDIRQLLPTVINGDNGKNYEVTVLASRKIFEEEQAASDPLPSRQYLPVHQQTGGNTSPNPRYYGNLQQSLLNNEQHLHVNSQQYANKAAISTVNNYNDQYRFSQFTSNVNNQQQQQQLFSQQQQLLNQQSMPQQQQHPANLLLSTQDQYQQYLQQPQQHNNNLPNSQFLLDALVKQQKYVSQSEAAQLDVYPYKQINGNTRPFKRVITKCDAKGQCEPQNASDDVHGGSDFLHQQVLKQTKAKIEHNSNKCQNKFNYQYTGNALVDNVAKAQRGIPIKKGTDLINRRLIPYTEVVIPQYPHN